MQSMKHPTSNHVLGAPPGWDQSKTPCDALWVTAQVEQGSAMLVSFWKPTPEELALLNQGYPVALSILGTGMPPVAVFVPNQPYECHEPGPQA